MYCLAALLNPNRWPRLSHGESKTTYQKSHEAVMVNLSSATETASDASQEGLSVLLSVLNANTVTSDGRTSKALRRSVGEPWARGQ